MVSIPAVPGSTSPGTTSQSSEPTLSNSTVTLSWNAVSGATSYEVAVKNLATNQFVVDQFVSGTSYQASLSPGGSYVWNVDAINSAGHSNFSSPLYFLTPASVSIPAVPGSTSPGTTSQSSEPTLSNSTATLSWNAVSGATSYEVAVKDLATNQFVVDQFVSGTSYQASLSPGGSYVWNVDAINSAGHSNFSSPLYFLTPASVSIPAVPGSTSPGTTSQSSEPTLSSSTVALSWNAVSGATSYEVAVKDLATNQFVVDQFVSGTSYQASLPSGGSYVWNVDAINSAGHSNFSTPLYFLTPASVSIPAVPGSTSPGTTSQSSEPTLSSSAVTLSWNAVSGATSYEVAVKDLATNQFVVDQFVSGTSYQASLPSGGSYVWNVDAINSAGHSNFSTPLYFLTPASVSIPAVPGSTSPGTTSQSSEPTLSSSAVTLSWNAVSGATSYEVAVKDLATNQFVVDQFVSGTSYQASLPSGGSYVWNVDAINSAGHSNFSTPLYFLTPGSGGGGGSPTDASSAGLDMSGFSASQTAAMIGTTNLQFIGYYLAPTENGNRIDASWMGERQVLMDQGWRLEPLYLGPAAGSSLFTAPEGTSEGQEAASFMASEGFVRGSAVFLDIEFTGLSTAVQNYIIAWSTAVANAGYQPGIYLAHQDASTVHQILPDVLLWTKHILTTAAQTDSSTTFATSDPNSGGYPNTFITQYQWSTTLTGVSTHPFVDLDASTGTVVGGPGNDIYSVVVGYSFTSGGATHTYTGTGPEIIDEQGQGGNDVLRVYGDGVVTNASTDLTYQIAANGNDLIIHPNGDVKDTVTIKNMSQALSQVETLAVYNQSGTQISQINLVDEFNALTSGHINHPPVVNIPNANVSAAAGQSFAPSSLFTVTDADNDAVTYFLDDASTAPGSGHFVVNGQAKPNGTVFALNAAQLAQTTFVAGTSGASDDLLVMAYDGQAYSGNTSFSELHVNVPVNHPPVVNIPNANVASTAGQSFSASSLFTVTDADNDALTYFLDDASTAPGSGHFVVNGQAKPNGTVFALNAAQLAQTTFVAGTSGASDDLLVMAYDGQAYSGNTSFNELHVNVPATNHPPVVNIPNANVASTAGQSFSTSSLFTVTDADNDALTYFLDDASTAPGSGHFVVNGQAKPNGTVFALNAAQLAQTTFVAGTSGASDDLLVMAYDGQAYSGNTSFSELHVNVPVNHPPVVNIPNANVASTAGQSFSASSLFTVTDADNDALTYFLDDASTAPGSGHFVVNGQAKPNGTVFALNAAQLAQTTFVAGTSGASDDLLVMAYDGQAYSGNTSFNELHVNVPATNHPPVVNIPNANVASTAGQSFSTSSLFTVTDADNDALTYFLDDASTAPGSGHFVVNGQAKPNGTVFALNAAQLAQTTFVAGTSGASDDLLVMAYDGQAYSGNTSFNELHVNVPATNHPPVVNIPSANVTAAAGQTFAASSLFSVSDADNDTLTYFLDDASTAPGSGHFVVNGQAEPNGTVFALNAAQLAQTTFVAGTSGASDNLLVMAYDGHDYSGNTSFNHFSVNVPVNHPPVVNIPSANVTAAAGQTFAASSLFSVSDVDNDTLTYFLDDASTAPGSGHFVFNGQAEPNGTVFALNAAQLAQTTFVAGTSGASDNLLVMAYDGHDYSGNTSFNHFSVNVPVNHPPVVNIPNTNVTAAAGQTFAASSLFSVSDVDNDTLTYFLDDASTAPGSGHFVFNGQAEPNGTVFALNAAQLAQTTFVAGTSGASDNLLVMAYDGHDYSGNTSFNHFSVNVPVNHPPVVNIPNTNVTAAAGQTFAASSLFSATDLDGDTLTYFLYDNTPAATSGHFAVNGNTVPAQTVIALNDAQIAQTTFVSGAAGSSDDLEVMVYDGHDYSGNTSFSHFHVLT